MTWCLIRHRWGGWTVRADTYARHVGGVTQLARTRQCGRCGKTDMRWDA